MLEENIFRIMKTDESCNKVQECDAPKDSFGQRKFIGISIAQYKKITTQKLLYGNNINDATEKK